MNRNLPQLVFKILLALFELLFVGGVLYLRFLDMGWMFIIFGILLLAWVLFHLALMAVFIAGFKASLIDIGLYLGVHFFYLAAWLFQSDGGDSGGVTWVIQFVYDSNPLAAFLQKMGDNLFYIMTAGTFVFYVLIGILLIVRLVRAMRARGNQARQ